MVATVISAPTPANPDDVREADLADLVAFLDDVVDALEQLARALDEIAGTTATTARGDMPRP